MNPFVVKIMIVTGVVMLVFSLILAFNFFKGESKGSFVLVGNIEAITNSSIVLQGGFIDLAKPSLNIFPGQRYTILFDSETKIIRQVDKYAKSSLNNSDNFSSQPVSREETSVSIQDLANDWNNLKSNGKQLFLNVKVESREDNSRAEEIVYIIQLN